MLSLSIAGAKDALVAGELGTAVSEIEFNAALARLLAAPKPDLRMITNSMRIRFGCEAFVAGATSALNRLMEARPLERRLVRPRGVLATSLAVNQDKVSE